MGDRQNIPLPKSNYELEIVLVGINHPGNLGAICRAMLNHGFDKLILVNPNCSPDDEEARNRAKHSGRILDDVKVHNTLESAVSESSLVIGTSGNAGWFKNSKATFCTTMGICRNAKRIQW